MSPLIGITTYNGTNLLADLDDPTAYLPRVYSDAVRRAGGRPVLLPAGGEGDEATWTVGNVDGIILPGGPDLNPALYGQPLHDETSQPDDERDAWDMAVAKNALMYGVPLLGICRGMQVMNVALGGTLHQHIPDLFEDVVDEGQLVEHDFYGRGFGEHLVIVGGGGLLESILGGEPMNVPTHHHQAINEVGNKLIPVGVASDGIIEAVEVESSDQFAVGVQWHPERGDDPRLFDAFVIAASNG
jgi:putative glutamine amidotransferase